MGVRTEANSRHDAQHRCANHAGTLVLLAQVALCLAGCATGEREPWRWPWEKPPVRDIKLRVHLADTEPVEGYAEHRDEYGERVFVSSDPIATERDVVFAEALHSDLRSVLVLRFDAITSGELEMVTADNVGKRLAVFVDDDYAVSAIIEGPVTQGGLALDIGMPREEAEAIVRGFAQQRAEAGEAAGP